MYIRMTRQRKQLNIYNASYYNDTKARPQMERLKKTLEERLSRVQLNSLMGHIRRKAVAKNYQSELDRLASMMEHNVVRPTARGMVGARQTRLREMLREMGLE